MTLIPEKLKNLYMELEFDTLGKRAFGKSFSSAQSRSQVIREKREKEIQQTLFDEPVDEKTIRDVKHDYRTVKTASRSKSTDQETACPGSDLL